MVFSRPTLHIKYGYVLSQTAGNVNARMYLACLRGDKDRTRVQFSPDRHFVN